METIRPLTTQELLFPVIEKVQIPINPSNSLPSISSNTDVDLALGKQINFVSSMSQKPSIGILVGNFIKKNRLPILVGGIVLSASILIAIDYIDRKNSEKDI
jgi:hypothetical protein